MTYDRRYQPFIDFIIYVGQNPHVISDIHVAKYLQQHSKIYRNESLDYIVANNNYTEGEKYMFYAAQLFEGLSFSEQNSIKGELEWLVGYFIMLPAMID